MNIRKFFKFNHVGGVRVVPVSYKIVCVLAVLIVASNITTNYASLLFSRINQIYFTKQLLVKDLKEISNFSNLQWQIYELNGDFESTLKSIREKSIFELKKPGSAIIGLKADGSVVFSSFDKNDEITLDATPILSNLNANHENIAEDFVVTYVNGEKYFGIYKLNNNWDMYIFRGEEEESFYKSSWQNFFIIIVVILFITLFSAITGIYVLRYILRFIGVITASIMEMAQQKQLTPIKLQGASNDDVTYLGISFNLLSQNMDTLVSIFKKFADRDIVKKAYSDKEVRLEGEQHQLTMLFTDIKGYTNMTETLGTDIIKLLNLQYDHSIDNIYRNDGAIASIIGDALLAVFGVMESDRNKSHAALIAANEILKSTRELQLKMSKKRAALIQKHGSLSEEEEAIYQAVLVEVGVGLDSGEVFYGTIGSKLRMTTTVIGDRVNSAARLEGLTRIYNVPLICSGSVYDDVRLHVDVPGFDFIQIDQVRVKGKTEATTLYWPVPRDENSDELKFKVAIFHKGLESYFAGDWKKSFSYFEQCDLALADVFKERTKANPPADWDGIWELKSK
ncbi:MAG: adenylate/guanylate cyclase domain-containing protein [Neptuniibacter sp.]